MILKYLFFYIILSDMMPSAGSLDPFIAHTQQILQANLECCCVSNNFKPLNQHLELAVALRVF